MFFILLAAYKETVFCAATTLGKQEKETHNSTEDTNKTLWLRKKGNHRIAELQNSDFLT